ncbi:hypothetical protein Ddc_22511 [Ditylenchus destructor]|nr:hypothetical protein Ddc_22511 [Ditylenchus destructor]
MTEPDDMKAWYKRHGDIFEEDGKDVSDAAKARLLVQKLGTAEHRKYLDSIKPKEPKELSFEASVKQLMSLFAPTISKVTRQYQCFHLKQSVSEDKISFASNVNSMWESCFAANVNLSTLKCVSFIAGLADSEFEARASCMRLLEKAEADDRVPTLDELKEQCKKVDVFNQGIASLSSQAQSMNINAVKAQHANRPITGKNRGGRKETINPDDLDPGQNSGKNAKCFKCDHIGHLASICPSLHKSNNINVGHVQVIGSGSEPRWNSGASRNPQNDGRKKANRSKLSKNWRSAHAEARPVIQHEDNPVDDSGYDYGIVRVASTQLVKTFSKHSHSSSHSLHSNSSLSPGCSNNTWQSFEPNCSKRNRFDKGARVYFQTWNPGVVISRVGNEYFVRSVEGPCISEECQRIAEDSDIALRVHQIRSRSAITAKEEQEVAKNS